MHGAPSTELTYTLPSRAPQIASHPASEFLPEPEASKWEHYRLGGGEGTFSSVCTIFSFALGMTVNVLKPACASDTEGAAGWQRTLVSLAARILCSMFFSLIVSPFLVVGMTKNITLWPLPPLPGRIDFRLRWLLCVYTKNSDSFKGEDSHKGCPLICRSSSCCEPLVSGDS